MNSKVKLFLIFLASMAVISVLSFFDVFKGVRSALIKDPSQPLPLDIAQDADQDGLSNSDESYWNTDFQNPDSDGDGFLDGEEVASGYDPREPSTHPLGDSILDTVYGSVKPIDVGDFEETNFTENAMGYLVGGLASGDLKKTADQDKKDSGLSILAVSTIDDFYKSMPMPNLESINIVQDSRDGQTFYLESLAYIIKNELLDFSQKPDLNQNPFLQGDYFSAKSSRFKSSLEKAYSLNVPQGWTEIHQEILTLLNRFHLVYAAVSSYDSDPVKAIIAFNDLEILHSTAKNIIEEINRLIKVNNLQPKDTVFDIMNSIY